MGQMAASLEEPDRFHVLRLLNSARTFRNLTMPKTNRPFTKNFTNPFLAHPTFPQSNRTLAPTYHQSHFDYVIHPPPATYVKQHTRHSNPDYNYKKWEEHFPRHTQLCSLALTPPLPRHHTNDRRTLCPDTARPLTSSTPHLPPGQHEQLLCHRSKNVHAAASTP